jgi:tetratricopeptide (TPR) repeat protein
MSLTSDMKYWPVIGLMATLVIVLSLPLYYLKVERPKSLAEKPIEQGTSTFVGTEKCAPCHRKQYDEWHNSHHDRAMEVADATTVLGDFNNAVFEIHGVESRFYRKEGKYFVHTQGPDGAMGDFAITHTFGWYPLQQYLIPFPGGRLQCLPIGWDVKEKKWYRLPPVGPLEPDDWLYWTNAGQNWNGMCAECHSTNLKKNYDPATDSYQTTWSDIDVGCEACHGPGSIHIAWAEMPDMGRPQVDNYRLVQNTSNTSARESVELCAPCHSRRAALGDYTHAEPDLLDSLLPSLLTEQLYFADGQIMEEVYVYGSFTQSKMYHREVRCSDCHDVHSIKLVKEGNALCLQCHHSSRYDTREHHFHKYKDEPGEPIRTPAGKVLFAVGTGADCVQCHMPGRYYMGIDYRPDHSFRIPRPHISFNVNAPDACLRCHVDKNPQWSDETMTKWYGPGRNSHYGEIIDRGRKQIPEAGPDLVKLAADPLYPVIVRATALSLLTAYPGEQSNRVMTTALMDEEALVRRTAVASIQLPDQEQLASLITPLLYDPVLAVRMEAANRLAGASSEVLDADHIKILKTALQEFETAMEYSADFAFGRYNLGNLYATTNRPEEAIDNYRAAIGIDSMFYPAQVNLAMLYNQRGENVQAEKLLREVTTAQPELYEVAYSLGLLLVEMQQYEAAADFLERAASGMPEHGRVHYNLGLLYQYLRRNMRAEKELLRALDIEPENFDFLYGLADHYIKTGQFPAARQLAEQMVATHPDNPAGRQMLNYINRTLGRE